MSQHAGTRPGRRTLASDPDCYPGPRRAGQGRSRSLRAGDWAWLAIAAGVVGYEIAASRRGYELLSEAVDRYRILYPLATNITIVYLAAHLVRIIPRRIDPLYLLGTRFTRRAP